MYTCHFSFQQPKKENKNWNYGLSNPSNQQPHQLIPEIVLCVIYFHPIIGISATIK